jgi:hypothetical protein
MEVQGCGDAVRRRLHVNFGALNIMSRALYNHDVYQTKRHPNMAHRETSLTSPRGRDSFEPRLHSRLKLYNIEER